MKHLIIIALVSLVNIMVAQKPLDDFISRTDVVLKDIVENDLVNYSKAKSNGELSKLVSEVADFNTNGLNDNEKKSFLINAYNLIVINEAAINYPLKSTQDIGGFFSRKKHMVAGKSTTLNDLEKKQLLSVYNDARFHFVLVCGAKGCPVIVSEAYNPANLNEQLDRQTRKALNDSNFIYEENGALQLSQIFSWYPKDFGGKNNIIPFINQYRTQKIPANKTLKYYNYDWSLNDSNSNSTESTVLGANAYRYVVSAAIPQGGVEIKLFNNLFTQRTGDGTELNSRSTFFTQSFSAIYGITNRFNAGLEARYRRVANTSLPSSAFSSAFETGPETTHRQGLTAIGPRIRFAPFKKLPNFSVQSTFSFAVGDNLEGDGTRPFIDWNGATFNTQLFNDHPIGTNFSLFTELDFIIEDIGGEGALNRFSTPLTGIISYFPNPKTTFYFLAGYSPFWQSNFDYFAQAGLGFKYQASPSFEVELLFTEFTNQFLESNNGDAATYNLGFRYSY